MYRTVPFGMLVVIILLLAGTDHLVAQSSATLSIRLKTGSFDPFTSTPSALASAQSEAIADNQEVFLVQFNGPVQEAWKTAMQQIGVQLYGYVPDYAFIARLNNSTAEQVQQLPFVRWVGPYRPAYKFDMQLAGASPSSDATIVVNIQTLPDVDRVVLEQRIVALGGTVLAHSRNELAGYMRAELPTINISSVALEEGVLWIEPHVEPTLQNNVSGGSIIQTNSVRSALGLYGKNQIIGVADSGLDTGRLDTLHPDVRGRVRKARCLGRTSPCDWSDPHGHGTHVTGSVIGNGTASGSQPTLGNYNSAYAGIAPEAELVFQSILDSYGGLSGIPIDTGDLMRQAYLDGARIHSNSWGGTTCANPPHCTNFGYGGYDYTSQQVDLAAWQHKDLLVLFAAGNNGVDVNKDGVIDADSINQPGTSKNALTVGAAEGERPEITATWGQWWPASFGTAPLSTDKMANNRNGMAAFSSRGPTDDGRIKPDAVAPGTFIASARSQHPHAGTGWGVINTYYMYYGGTSMSTPLTAGAAAIVREWLTTVRGVVAPSAALMKAILLNGTVNMSPGQYGNSKPEVPAVQPNSVAGWGRIDLQQAVVPPAPQRIWFADNTNGVATSESAQYTISIGSPARSTAVMTSATDAPAQALLTIPTATQPNQADSNTSTAQLLQNNGFEQGNWTSWQIYGAPRLMSDVRYAGAWAAMLGNGINARDQLTQTITIPSNASSITFDFRYRLRSQETRAGTDRACYGFWSTDASAPPYMARCLDLGVLGNREWTQESYTLSGDQLTAVKGKTVIVGLLTISDDTLASEVWIDETAVSIDTASAPAPVRMILAWTDYPGEPSATKALVNDLDLEVIAPDGTRYRGNQGAYAAGHRCLRSGGWDACNNIEGVIIPQGKPGNYTIVVRGAHVPQGGRQPFALSMTGNYARAEYSQTMFVPLAIN